MAIVETQTTQAEKWQRWYRERRFGILFMILFVLLVAPPMLIGFGLSSAWFDGIMALLMLAAILSLCFENHQRLFALLLGIATIIFSLVGHALAGEVGIWVLFFGHLCNVLFLFGAAGLIIKFLFGSRLLTFDSIFGAACGYLFLGLGWAVFYSLIESFQPGSFEIKRSLTIGGEPTQPLSQVLVYYSFVTLTTVGYGDVIPVSATTRTLAWMEAITGQFYLAVIVAGLVSVLVARAVASNERQSSDG